MSETYSPHLVFEVFEDLRLVVSYQSALNPSDTEWDAWVEATTFLEEAAGEFGLLVVTEGGHPSKDQVKRLEAAKRKHRQARGKRWQKPTAAIISPSSKIRFVTSVMTFMNSAIRCFSPDEMAAAYAHLGLSIAQSGIVDAAIQRLRAQVRAVWTVA